MRSKQSPYVIQVDPGFEFTKDITTTQDIYNKIKNETGMKQNIGLKFQKYCIDFEKFLTLPECGFDFSKKFSFIVGSKITLFFRYENFLFPITFSSFQSIFDVKFHLALYLHTVPCNIELRNPPKDLCGIISSNENNPIELEFPQGYSLFKVIEWSKDNLLVKYYLFMKGTKISQLRSTIACYNYLPGSRIKIFFEDQDIIFNDNTELFSIQKKTIFYELSKETSRLSTVTINFVNRLNEFKFDIPDVYTEVIGEFSSFYDLCVSIEFSTLIDRKATLFDDAKDSKELQNQNSINIEISKLAILDIIFDGKCDSKNIKVPLFLKGQDLKNIITSQFNSKIKVSNHHFGIVINDKFIFNDNFIAGYLSLRKGNYYGKVYVITQDEESNSLCFYDRKKKVKASFIIPTEMTILEMKNIICPNKKNRLISIYHNDKKSKDNFKFSDLRIKPDEILEYEITKRDKKVSYSLFYRSKKKIESKFKFSSDKENSQIKDVFEFLLSKQKKKFAPKKRKLFYYIAYPTNKNQSQFSFNDNLNQLCFSPQDSNDIYVFKVKEKIEYNVYNVIDGTTTSFKEDNTVFKNDDKLNNSINALKQKLNININSNQLLLFSDYIQLKDEDIPIFCFPINHTYIINTQSDSKILFFEHEFFVIKKEFQKDDFLKIPKIISEIFGIKKREITFYFANQKLPLLFSAAAFKNESKIKMDLPIQKKFKFKFSISNQDPAKTISIYNCETLDRVKLTIQKEFDLLNYSPKCISLYFQENKITKLDCFKYLNDNCTIIIKKDKSNTILNQKKEIKLNFDIFNNTEMYYLLNMEKIDILKELVSLKYGINDFTKIKILNQQGNELEDNESCMKDTKYTIKFPSVNIIWNGCLENQNYNIEVSAIHNINEAKKKICDFIKLNDDTFALFTKKHGIYYSLHKNKSEKINSFNEKIYAHRYIPDLHIFHIVSGKKEDIIHSEMIFSEHYKLSLIRTYIRSKLNLVKIDFGFNSLKKEPKLEDMTLFEYFKKQKELYPNLEGNCLYVFDKEISNPSPTNQIQAADKSQEQQKMNQPLSDHTSKPNSNNNNSNNSKNNFNNSKNSNKNSNSIISNNNSIINSNNYNNNNTNISSSSNNNNNNIKNNNDIDNNSQNNNNKKEVIFIASDYVSSSNNSIDNYTNMQKEVNNSDTNEVVDKSSLIEYKFYNHELNALYTLHLDENAKIIDAKTKLHETIQSKNKSWIDLIFCGKKLRDKILLKSMHLTNDDQIKVFVHNYELIRVDSFKPIKNRNNI